MVRALLKRKIIPNIFSDLALDMTNAGNRIRKGVRFSRVTSTGEILIPFLYAQFKKW